MGHDRARQARPGRAAACYKPRMQTEETTALLLDRAGGGDGAERERLAARYLPMLRRWAHGRLPP